MSTSNKENNRDRQYRDEDTLRRLYWDERLSQAEVADELGCSERTVVKWMQEHNIETRTGRRRLPWATYVTNENGYERWQNRSPPDKGASALVHRLLAVAEYGFEAVRGNHVHHINGIPWDNRIENLEILSPSDHMGRHHATDLEFSGEGNPNAKLTRDEVKQIWDCRNSHTAEELAEQTGATVDNVRNIWQGSTWTHITDQ